MASIQRARLGIQDLPRLADAVYTANGLDTRFTLPHLNIVDGTAWLNVNGAWSATGATFNPSGYVEFTDRISASSAFRVAYTHSTFSDSDISAFMAGGTVLDAQIAAIEVLMFDSLKRASWRSSDGTSYNDTQAQATLQSMHARLLMQRADASMVYGGVVNWS